MSLQLLLIVLNKVEKLDDLLETLLEEGYSGATIINSTGMISKMAKHMENYPIFGSLRFLVDFDREENITIFMALKDEQVESVKKIVRNVIGDLSQPNTAVMFTLPILSVEGIDI
jgi:nitrogen regulatory protein PII